MSKIVAYACSTRPNALWSAEQFNSAAEKNRTECDIPLVSLKDHEAAMKSETNKLRSERDQLRKALADMLPPDLPWKRDADGVLIHHQVAAINAARAALATTEETHR